MRWLLLKDLQILRRSPLLVALLVAYPILVALLIGFALSGGPDKPRVAFLNQVPESAETFDFGGERLNASAYAGELFKAVEPIRVRTREEALEKVRSGEALGALIVPPDIVERLQGTLALSGGDRRPTLEVVYNVEDPVKARFVESTIKARLSDANRLLSERITQEGAKYLEILLRGGRIALPLVGDVDVLGLVRSQQIIEDAQRRLPRGSAARAELERVERFAGLAVENLDLSDEILQSIGEPVAVKRTVLNGSRTPLDSFAVAVAVTISLMFVCVLLAAGMLALEREEHAFGRLVRGLVSRSGLVLEKAGLAAACAFTVTVLLLGGLSVFIDVDWGRAPLWLLALALGALAFGAMGVAIGGLAKDLRAASLLGFLLTLPIAFLALVPSGTVSAALFDVIRGVSAAFPFRPTLRALDAGLNDTGQGLAGPLLHLAALAIAFAAVARLALRRFS
jgi:ABC-2 type transport system permease protein